MDLELLKKLQKTELNILIDFDNYCKSHNLQYSLYAGTALGAVRHKGFIPWDDDVDVIMTRNNYIKFCELWKANPLDGYFLQNNESVPNSGISHAKLRKDGTILLSESEDEKKGHHGVWIDIFILDKVPIGKKEKYVRRNAYKKFIYSRSYAIRKGEKGKTLIIKKILSLIPISLRQKGLRKAENNILKFKDLQTDYEWMSLACLEGLKYKYAQDITERYISIKFEDYELQIFEKYDLMLATLFGDYMKLPPKEQQVCKHKPVKIKL